jgi:hypothetical protein
VLPVLVLPVLVLPVLVLALLGLAVRGLRGLIRGAGNNGPVSTAKASSFLNAAGTMGG